jgi:2-methylcitrate dehydratase PrpD
MGEQDRLRVDVLELDHVVVADHTAAAGVGNLLGGEHLPVVV